MARRGRSSLKPAWIYAGLALLFVAFIGSQFFKGGTSHPDHSTPALDVSAYMENANSLRGNVYRLDGEVLNALAWSPTAGRLIAVGPPGNTDVVPVLVPDEFKAVNIQKGQKFVFVLEVDERGILRVKKMTKS